MADRSTTLIINRSDSKCGNCNRGADPHDEAHVKCLGYAPQPEGCGVVWTHVTTDYTGDDIAERAQAMRPDLIFVDPMGALK